MNYKHITTIAILTVMVVPTLVFAQTNIELKRDLKSREPKVSNENQIRKNRIERVNYALKAMEGNASMVEKAINQASLRIEGIDSTKKDIPALKSDLEKAKAKVAEARTVITAAKELTKTMDPQKKEDVEAIRSKIGEARKLIREAINTTKSVVKKLKAIKIILPKKEAVSPAEKK